MRWRASASVKLLAPAPEPPRFLESTLLVEIAGVAGDALVAAVGLTAVWAKGRAGAGDAEHERRGQDARHDRLLVMLSKEAGIFVITLQRKHHERSYRRRHRNRGNVRETDR